MSKIKFDKNIEIEIILDSIDGSLNFKDEFNKIVDEYSNVYDFEINVSDKTTEAEYKSKINNVLLSFEKEDIEKYGKEVQDRIFKENEIGISR